MMAAVVAAACETSVEVVLPEGGSCLQLCCSGWSSSSREAVARVEGLLFEGHPEFE